MRTLPDYLRPGLDLVFVGINPGTYSVLRGHYFARTNNRFWPAFSRSRLSAPIRTALAVDRLGPEHDATLLDFGIGFTDVVKRPSASAAGLTPADYARGVPRLVERLTDCRPRVACFHGLTAYRPFAVLALRLRARETIVGARPGPVSHGLRARETIVGGPSGPPPHGLRAGDMAVGARSRPSPRGLAAVTPALGAQRARLGATRLFVVPNPSPANAHFTVVDQTAWYDRLARFLSAGARNTAAG